MCSPGRTADCHNHISVRGAAKLQSFARRVCFSSFHRTTTPWSHSGAAHYPTPVRPVSIFDGYERRLESECGRSHIPRIFSHAVASFFTFISRHVLYELIPTHHYCLATSQEVDAPACFGSSLAAADLVPCRSPRRRIMLGLASGLSQAGILNTCLPFDLVRCNGPSFPSKDVTP